MTTCCSASAPLSVVAATSASAVRRLAFLHNLNTVVKMGASSHHVVLLCFLLLSVVSAHYFYPNQTNIELPFPDLIHATTEELGTGLERGLFTSCDLVKAYIARIQEVNSTLHIVTEINPDALSIAAELDAERANGTTRGPLHGMPILIKGNFEDLFWQGETHVWLWLT